MEAPLIDRMAAVHHVAHHALAPSGWAGVGCPPTAATCAARLGAITLYRCHKHPWHCHDTTAAAHLSLMHVLTDACARPHTTLPRPLPASRMVGDALPRLGVVDCLGLAPLALRQVLQPSKPRGGVCTAEGLYSREQRGCTAEAAEGLYSREH